MLFIHSSVTPPQGTRPAFVKIASTPRDVERLRSEFETLQSIGYGNSLFVSLLHFSLLEFGAIHVDGMGTPFPTTAKAMVLTRGRKSLRECLSEGRIEQLNAAMILRDMLKALECLHSKKYVHLDLKPDNVVVFLGPNDTELIWKLIDFDSSAQIGTQLSHSHVFSPNYSPPEVLEFASNPSMALQAHVSIDVWAIGLMALEMHLGQLTFDCFKTNESMELFFRTHLSKTSDEKMRTFVQDCLKVNPSLRSSASLLQKKSLFLNSANSSVSVEHFQQQKEIYSAVLRIDKKTDAILHQLHTHQSEFSRSVARMREDLLSASHDHKAQLTSQIRSLGDAFLQGIQRVERNASGDHAALLTELQSVVQHCSQMSSDPALRRTEEALHAVAALMTTAQNPSAALAEIVSTLRSMSTDMQVLLLTTNTVRDDIQMVRGRLDVHLHMLTDIILGQYSVPTLPILIPDNPSSLAGKFKANFLVRRYSLFLQPITVLCLPLPPSPLSLFRSPFDPRKNVDCFLCAL
jgi:serine/threonine protein kinase